MKKASLIVLVLLFVLAGCGGKAKEEAASPGGASASPQASKAAGAAADSGVPANAAGASKGYAFEINGVSIAMHAEAAPILKQLGDPKDYFESEACAFPGLEKVYQFSSFDLYTYELNGVDYIASVVLFDDTVATKEGVALFSKKDDVLKTYGDGFTNDLNLYVYEKDRAQLRFVIEEDQVTSIEYLGTLT